MRPPQLPVRPRSGSPAEAHNLATDPAHEPDHADLAARLERWMRETNDPLLGGPAPAPPGALLNDPAARSAAEPTFEMAPTR